MPKTEYDRIYETEIERELSEWIDEIMDRQWIRYSNLIEFARHQQ